MSTERLDTYGYFMHDIARHAGDIIRSGFDTSLDVTIKDDGTPVTLIDRDIDRMVLSGIQENFPGHGYLGEETGGDTGAERFWVCDPLDGTKAYLSGIPLATFSLSLVEHGEIVCSIIHDPFMDRSLIAAKNEGTWMNGRQRKVSKQTSLKNADVHISWGDAGYLRRLSSLRDLGARVIKMDATVYVGMLVSIGNVDADIFTGNNLWDIAPQTLAVTEAGGCATTLSGNPIPATEAVAGLIISNRYIHDQIVDIVQASRGDD